MKKLIALATAATMLLGVTPAFAAGDVVVSNTNSATVSNVVSSSAVTGNNTADGARAANRTSGGDIDHSGAANKAGNVGSTVLGGNGGMISTGSATAVSEITNRLNTNRAQVELTPWATNDVHVGNTNGLSVGSMIEAAADTGSNTGNGARAHGTTSGGNVDHSGDANTSGNGGSDVEGGNGGHVTTGNSSARSSVLNVLNRNITRINK
jgi:hypothetical protein